MTWTPREERAIAYYVLSHDYRLVVQPGKSRHVRLQDKRDGRERVVELDAIIAAYDQELAQRGRDRARAKQGEARR